MQHERKESVTKGPEIRNNRFRPPPKKNRKYWNQTHNVAMCETVKERDIIINISMQ